MAKKKITQLDPATSVNSDALFPLSQEDNNEDKTFKGTIEQLGDYINKSQDFNTLNTTSKKVISAINEVFADANKDIISAITTPSPIMTFNDGGDNIPVKKLEVEFKATQSSGTPTPSSPLPITGWSSVDVSVSDGVTPTTVTIALGDTYYGGVLDTASGKLTITHEKIDMGSVTWTMVAVGTYNVFYYVESSKDDTFDLMCSCYKATNKTRTELLNLEMGIYNTSNAANRITIRDDSISSSTAFQNSVQGQMVIFKLATPVVINLTPAQIATLSGLNNIYADCGDIQELEYFNENADDVAELNRAMSDDFHIYSTAEQIVGKWLGEDLYEKSYHYTQATVPSQSTAVVIDNAISSLNMASLVDFTCVYKAHHISENYDVWYHGALANTQLDYKTGNLLFYQKATSQQQNYSDLEVNITIRYTKAS